MDARTRIDDELSKGFCCSEIIMKLYLEEAGKDNPSLVKAMGGFCGGIDGLQTCGALASACCAIVDASEDRNATKMERLLFVEKFVEKNGGCICNEILGGDDSKRATICPTLVEETYYDLVDFLEDNSLL